MRRVELFYTFYKAHIQMNRKYLGFCIWIYLHITFVDVYEENMTSRLYGTGKEKHVLVDFSGHCGCSLMSYHTSANGTSFNASNICNHWMSRVQLHLNPQVHLPFWPYMFTSISMCVFVCVYIPHNKNRSQKTICSSEPARWLSGYSCLLSEMTVRFWSTEPTRLKTERPLSVIL